MEGLAVPVNPVPVPEQFVAPLDVQSILIQSPTTIGLITVNTVIEGAPGPGPGPGPGPEVTTAHADPFHVPLAQ